MVYGLDAILHMKFLIPTMQVVHVLNWTKHELLDRLEEQEQLDETRLDTITSVYALKRRQKQFHDCHIITKHFKLGDLVLVFTLKELVAKLSKRGKGPYVISDLSPSGAIKLSTLEGDEMPNWISGFA